MSQIEPAQQGNWSQSGSTPPIQAYPRHPQYGPGVEPSDVGPAAGGDLRVADADRNLCMDVLNTAYADGRITRAEHAERIDTAARARVFDDLIPLTRDLVREEAPRTTEVSTGAGIAPTGPAHTGPVVEDNPNDTEPDRMMAFLGDVRREGAWRVRKELQVFVGLGDIKLDFTNAIFEADTIEVTGFTALGDLTMIVPPGVNVRMDTSNVLGSSNVKDVPDAPGGPTIVVRSVVMLGDIKARGPHAKLTRSERRHARRDRRHGCGH